MNNLSRIPGASVINLGPPKRNYVLSSQTVKDMKSDDGLGRALVSFDIGMSAHRGGTSRMQATLKAEGIEKEYYNG